MVEVQVCGVMNSSDALMCEEEGVSNIGFVLFENRKRSVTPSRVREISDQLSSSVSVVAIIHHEDVESMMSIAREANADFIQTYTQSLDDLLTLRDNGFRIINSVLIDIATGSLDISIEKFIEINEASEMILFEPTKGGVFGGIGLEYDYESVLPKYIPFCERFAISGGLTPFNVSKALSLNPHTINVSSGVEDSSGCKDRKLVRGLVRKCRSPVSLHRRMMV